LAAPQFPRGAAYFFVLTMDFALILSALQKHERMAQAAVNFAREHGKGALFMDAMNVLDEAIRARKHVEKMRDLRRGVREKVKPVWPPANDYQFEKVQKDLTDIAKEDDDPVKS